MSRSPGRVLLIVTAAVVVASVALALTMMDSPGTQRLVRLDERRTEDLRQLQRLVEHHYEAHRRLPSTLADLQQPGMTLPMNDPEAGTPYGYRVVDDSHYQLCASFAMDTARLKDGRRAAWVDPQWAHPAGLHCLQREAPKLP